MSDKTALSGAALTTAGLLAAGVFSSRAARAATPTTHVTFYAVTPPSATADPNVVQIPNTSTQFTSPSTDVQVVNFALAVETVEAERYRQAIARLTTGGTDMFGNPINGLGASSTDLDVLLLTGFYQTESQQRDILSTVLYGSPANNPFLNTSQYLFDFAINSKSRVQATMDIYTAETVGVSAYLGGSGLLSIKSAFLPTAAAFLGVEARHAAALAYVLTGLDGTPVQTAPLASDSHATPGGTISGADTPLTADQILWQTGQVAAGLLPATGGVTPALTGPNGFVFRPS